MKSRCLTWEPSNEQEVVVLFGRLLDHMPRPVAIEFVQTGFPDCKAIDVETREPLWIEFELYVVTIAGTTLTGRNDAIGSSAGATTSPAQRSRPWWLST